MNMDDTTSTAAPRITSYLDRPDGRIGYDVTGTGPLIVPGMGDLRAGYRFPARSAVLAAAGRPELGSGLVLAGPFALDPAVSMAQRYVAQPHQAWCGSILTGSRDA
jgi:hypothetical protein